MQTLVIFFLFPTRKDLCFWNFLNHLKALDFLSQKQHVVIYVTIKPNYRG